MVNEAEAVRADVITEAVSTATPNAPTAVSATDETVAQASAPAATIPAEVAVTLAPEAPATEVSIAPSTEPAAQADVPATTMEAPFVLPLADLEAIARNAGLEWVNSDVDKIRAAQEAIANEPKPVHVPRERKPPVQLDEGPLILVETRKDLKDGVLPFEEQASA